MENHNRLFEREVLMKIPRRVHTAVRSYRLDRKRVLDCGCGSGEYLRYFGPGSVGIELQESLVEKAKSKGLEVRQANLEEDRVWPAEEEGFDAIWCSNYLEHSLSPHGFLVKARRYLKDEGRIVVVLPIVQGSGLLRLLLERIPAWRGAYAHDHVSFYTRHTALETLRRAGFHDVDARVASFRSPGAMALANLFLKPFWFSLVFSGKKTPNWNYPPKAHKTLTRDGVIAFKK